MDKIDTNSVHSQCELVMEHLKQFGHLGMIEAEKKYNIYRLASIIHYIKKKNGLKIINKSILCEDKFGKKKNTADYYLINE